MPRGQCNFPDPWRSVDGATEMSFTCLETIGSEESIQNQKHHKKHKKQISKTSMKYSIDKTEYTTSYKHLDASGDVIDPGVMKLKLCSKVCNDTHDDFELVDFSRLINDYKVTNIYDQTEGKEEHFDGDCFDAIDSHTDLDTPTLSQRNLPLPKVSVQDQVTMNEREAIEEEIKRKYAELEEIMERINASKRTRIKHRRKYKLRKYDQQRYASGDEWVPSYVNICPIKRRKRPAQPIRNAVLIRTAMKKAWRGMLGSCCGKGCWATWQWINLGHVISDYE